jgi:hypothetical protein
MPDLLPGCTVTVWVYKGNNDILPNFLIPAFEAKLKAEMERQRLGIAEAAGGVCFFYLSNYINAGFCALLASSSDR